MKLLRPHGLALRLSALVLTASGAVFAAIVLTTYFLAREALLQHAEASARNKAQAIVNRIESVLTPIPNVVQGIVYDMEDGHLTEAEIFHRQRRVLQDNDAVYGTAAAFEPDGWTKGRTHFAPYTFRTPLGPKATFLGGPAYRYHAMDWYQIPRELDRLEWSEPYFDEGAAIRSWPPVRSPSTASRTARSACGGHRHRGPLPGVAKRLVAGTSVLDTGTPSSSPRAAPT